MTNESERNGKSPARPIARTKDEQIAVLANALRTIWRMSDPREFEQITQMKPDGTYTIFGKTPETKALRNSLSCLSLPHFRRSERARSERDTLRGVKKLVVTESSSLAMVLASALPTRRFARIRHAPCIQLGQHFDGRPSVHACVRQA